MFTVCPKCALTLVVTAADLRVAQGYVRCGRCSSVFNALARLSDERQAAAAADEPPAPLSSPVSPEPTQEADADLSPLEQALARPDEDAPPEPPAPPEEPIPEGALEFNPDTTDVGAVFVQPPPNPQWTAATGSFKAMRAASQTSDPQRLEEPPGGTGESQVDVEMDAEFLADLLRAPARESAATRPVPAAPPAAPAAAPPDPAAAQPPARGSRRGSQRAARASGESAPAAAAVRARAAARPPSAHTRPSTQASARAPVTREGSPPAHGTPGASAQPAVPAPRESTTDEVAAEPVPERSLLERLDPRAWAAAAAVALLVLLAQIVNHQRDELATNPRFSGTLNALYGSLGVQLTPHWDLHAYDVRQLGASGDPTGSGQITVRASIKNAGSRAQPLPLLRVTLQDRFGNRIAARDVAPRFYVPHTIPESSYLAGGQRIDAEMEFVDPGANAVGFEIDACLPGRAGVTCANDLAVR